MRGRKGATLVELMLAGAILALVVTSLFEGILVANRIAHENAELLAAQAIAADAAWWRFNEKYDGKGGLEVVVPMEWRDLSRTAAPLQIPTAATMGFPTLPLTFHVCIPTYLVFHKDNVLDHGSGFRPYHLNPFPPQQPHSRKHVYG